MRRVVTNWRRRRARCCDPAAHRKQRKGQGCKPWPIGGATVQVSRSQTASARSERQVFGPGEPANGAAEPSVREVRCGQCGVIAYLCPGCDRGQRYCGEPCRRRGYARTRREARRRHRHSEAGRLDHRDGQRRYRQRKKMSASVVDQGPQEVAPASTVCPAQTLPVAPTESGLARRNPDGNRVVHDDEAGSEEQMHAGDMQAQGGGRAAKALASGQVGQAQGVAWPTAPLYCAVCRRPARASRPGFMRRARRMGRSSQGVAHRGRAPPVHRQRPG
jgi:hypothetical protein